MPTYAQKALRHAQNIAARAPGGRGSATASETHAADYIRHQLAGLGITDVRTHEFRGLRSANLFIALAFGFSLLGHAAYGLLRPPLGAWSLLVVAAAFAFSLFLLVRKYTFRPYPFAAALPHGPSQNVLARIPATGEPGEKIVLLAHLDTHRAVWWYAGDRLVKGYLLATPVAVGGVFLAPLFYLVAALAGIDLLAWLAFPFACLHFIAWFTGVTADLGPNSPGANDNASAIGTVLALAERLQAEPLPHTEVWLAFTGCEETGAEGMCALLDEQGDLFEGAFFLDFEMVGIGSRLVYVQKEGIVFPRRIPPRAERRILDAGASFDLRPVRMAGFGALTEIGAVLARGGQGVCLMAQRPGSPLPPEWHRLSDTADRLELAALERIHELAWGVLKTSSL
ncbi:MAG: M28 family peptidase [Chloroflexota bacterium]